MERTHKTGAAIRAFVRRQLLGRYSAAVMAELVCSLVSMAAAFVCNSISGPVTSAGLSSLMQAASTLIVSLLLAVIGVGKCCFYLNLINDRKVSVSDIFAGFKSYADRAIIISFIITVMKIVVTLPLTGAIVYAMLNSTPMAYGAAIATMTLSVVLLVYISVRFSQVNYIILDFPELSVTEILARSSYVMKGNALRYIGINLAFVPYYILGILSGGIAFVWITPYKNATMAEFYMDVAQ